MPCRATFLIWIFFLSSLFSLFLTSTFAMKEIKWHNVKESKREMRDVATRTKEGAMIECSVDQWKPTVGLDKEMERSRECSRPTRLDHVMSHWVNARQSMTHKKTWSSQLWQLTCRRCRRSSTTKERNFSFFLDLYCSWSLLPNLRQFWQMRKREKKNNLRKGWRSYTEKI